MLLPDLTRSATIIVRTGFNKLILILAVRKAKYQIKILVLLKVTMTQIQEGFPLQQSSKCEYRYQQKEKWALTPSMRTFIIETQ